MKGRIRYILCETADKLSAFMNRHRMLLGCVSALVFSLLLAVYNVSSGPLRNLNDIGGWSNRALFIAMTAAVHALLLMLCAALSACSYVRTLLRQMIVTAGLYILLIAINQKAYAYIQVMQPVIRAMDGGGLAAAVAMKTDFSAPMLAVLYAITRGPVYDMYLLKLFAIVCLMVMYLVAMRAAERRGLGVRTEVLLALLMILPQGFMNAACSALPEIAAGALLAVSLALAFDADKPRMTASAALLGAACALSGVCLYAMPLYAMLVCRGRMGKKTLALVPAVMAAACVPAVLGGMPVCGALLSLVHANLGLPAYAMGAPGLMNLIPRAAVEEMPQYAPTLSHFAELDLVTNAQVYYTQAHFEQLAVGFAVLGLAVYMGACALAFAKKEKSGIERVMILTLGALIACPNTTAAMWLLADVLCLYAIVAAPKLRVPACLVLFATMCAASYPMTEEVLLPMVYAFVLVLLALLMLLDVVPKNRKEEERHE